VARSLPWDSEIRLDGPGRTRALLLSGFGSGAETLRDLGDHLRERKGATVLLTGLARHAGDPGAFEQSRSWDYVREAERRFLDFWREQGTPVHLGGYSMGALVALVIGARYPEKVAGLVLVSPALRLSSSGKQLVGYTVGSSYYVLLPAGLLAVLAGIAWTAHKRGWPRSRRLLRALGSTAVFATAALGLRAVTVPLAGGGPLVRDGEELLPPHFARASLVGSSTLVPLQLAARWQLRRTSLPVCLVFGEADETVAVRFATLRAAGRHNVMLHVVAGAPHRVVTYEDCHEVVTGFVTSTTPRLPAP